MGTLRFILGDQLSHNISSLQNADKKKDVVLMCEVAEEATYVKHHPKKIILIFSAMRHFAKELSDKGFLVDYVTLDDPKNTHCFQKELQRALKKHKLSHAILTHPSEYRVLKALNDACKIVEDNRFLCTTEAFSSWAANRKQLRMEFFYRQMRKKYNILMRNGKPTGGKWNYDQENRLTLKPGLKIPKRHVFKPDALTKTVITLVKKRFKDHFGEPEPFDFAVTRQQALKVLRTFTDERLKDFGTYQDAMQSGEPWLYHSHISFYLNCGLLLPKECIEAAVAAYHHKKAPLNSVEGFVRQILGWREYVRGIYWLKMPAYKENNFFNATNPLPDFFWTGKTQMNCLKQCITETKQNAYAHHIQRLMIIGNFCLLAGIDPKFVNEWYLIVYADAYEWVELPNVSGMALFADGGLLASKPYAASATYIHKMSNYCENCRYKASHKTGEKACPFNYLYWDFLLRNHKKLASNPRMRLMLSKCQSMEQQKIETIKHNAKQFFQQLQKGES